MIRFVLPIVFTLLLWWFSTGAIFFLDSRPRHTFRWSMAGASVLAAGAVYALVQTSDDTTILGAYAAFACGLVIWGWLEIGYYMGFMIGPRREASPEGCGRWQHFLNAAGTTLYHELAALALGALIAAVTWDRANTLAFWTFAILWSMQLSAKLNVFLGVPNLAEEFLPAHLAFLRSFMTRKPMNLFFPIAVSLSMVLATCLVGAAASADATQVEAIGLTMLATLVGLAILEHWFLVVPLPFEALWRWSLGGSAGQTTDIGAESAAPHKRVGSGFVEPSLTQAITP